MLNPIITVVENVYYRPRDESIPTEIITKVSRDVLSGEQPYKRFLRLNQEWVRLNPYWFEDLPCSLLIIKNLESVKADGVILTAEQLLDVNKRVVEVTFNKAEYEYTMCPFYIPPQESFRGCPASVDNVYLRCRYGNANVEVHILPT